MFTTGLSLDLGPLQPLTFNLNRRRVWSGLGENLEAFLIDAASTNRSCGHTSSAPMNKSTSTCSTLLRLHLKVCLRYGECPRGRSTRTRFTPRSSLRGPTLHSLYHSPVATYVSSIPTRHSSRSTASSRNTRSDTSQSVHSGGRGQGAGGVLQQHRTTAVP